MAEAASRRPAGQLTQDQIVQLASALAGAIGRGDKFAAAEVARNLASECAPLHIHSTEPSTSKASDSESVSLTVHIEDRIEAAEKNKLTVKVWPGMTYLELKLMFYERYGLPVECQKWIHNRSIKADRDTLAGSGIATSGHTVYLYVVSKDAASIRAGPADYQPPAAAIRNSRQRAGAAPALGATGQRAGIAPTLGASGQPRVQMEPVPQPFTHQTLAPNIPLVAGNTPGGPAVAAQPAAEEPFLWRPPEKKQVGALPVRGMAPSNQREVAAHIGAEWQMNAPQHLGGGPAIDAQLLQQQQPHPQQQQHQQQQQQQWYEQPAAAAPAPTPLLESEDEIPDDGWACTACTLRNHPTRPGCTACSTERPAQYALPERYQHEEERIRAQVRAEQQRLLVESQADRQQRLPAPDT